MSEARQLAKVNDYDGLIAAFRARAAELNVSRETLDAVTGLQTGYAAKLLAPVPMKKLGLVSLGPMLQALGLALCVVVDEQSIARFSTQLSKRRRSVLSCAENELIVVRKTRRTYRRMGKRGAKIRLKKVSPKKRQAIARRAGQARWRRARLAAVAARKRARERIMRAALAATALQALPG